MQSESNNSADIGDISSTSMSPARADKQTLDMIGRHVDLNHAVDQVSSVSHASESTTTNQANVQSLAATHPATVMAVTAHSSSQDKNEEETRSSATQSSREPQLPTNVESAQPDSSGCVEKVPQDCDVDTGFGKKLSQKLNNQADQNCLAESADGDCQSDISDFSNFSEESWQPVQGPISWVQEQMRRGRSPRDILEELVPSGTVIPEGLDTIMLWKIIINIVSEPPKRKKLSHVNTMDDVLRLLSTCKKIVVLTGAGVSVSCGIPDFRSRDGVYARLAEDFPNLPDPQAMFDIHFFRNDPRPFFKFAKEIYPGQFHPSLCHHFIRLLEEKGKLLRNYTQNIDTLEQVAGIQKVVQCHGSFATATCTACGSQTDSETIREDIFNQVIPRCMRCPTSVENAVMKPDIVFFGESLPEHFHNQMAGDKDECDLLIVIGSSLKVRPVALIPNSLPPEVPQILINRERLHYLNFDIELLGNCDDIVSDLCRRLGSGWDQLVSPGPPLTEVAMSSLPTPPASPSSGDSRLSNKIEESSSADKSFDMCSRNSFENNNQEDNPTNCGDDQSIASVGKCPIGSIVCDDKCEDGNEVTTSQLNGGSVHSEDIGHQRQSAKRRFSSVACSEPTFSGPSSCSSTSDACAGKSSVDVNHQPCSSCSPETMDTIVNACHKRDVMYLPTKKLPQLSSQDSNSSVHHHSNVPGHAHHHDPMSDHHQRSHFHHHQHHQHHHNRSTFSEPGSEQSTHDIHASNQNQDLDSALIPGNHSRKNMQEDVASPEESEPCEKRPKLSPCENQEESNMQSADINDIGDDISQEGSLEDIRKMWQAKRRISLAQRISDDQVLFLPPSRYVFKGAEVFSESEEDDEDDDVDDDDDDDDEDISNEGDSDGNDDKEENRKCILDSHDNAASLSKSLYTENVEELADSLKFTASSHAPTSRVEEQGSKQTMDTLCDLQEENANPVHNSMIMGVTEISTESVNVVRESDDKFSGLASSEDPAPNHLSACSQSVLDSAGGLGSSVDGACMHVEVKAKTDVSYPIHSTTEFLVTTNSSSPTSTPSNIPSKPVETAMTECLVSSSDDFVNRDSP